MEGTTAAIPAPSSTPESQTPTSTEQPTASSTYLAEAQQSQPAPAPLQQVQSGPGGGGTGPWYSILPDDLKTDKNITKFASVAELAKGYNNASALVGRDKIPMPQTDEEMRGVLQRLGMPMEHKEYKLGPELGPNWQDEDFQVSPEPGVTLEKWTDCYKQLCHEYGFTQKQAEKMYARVARETNALEKRKAASIEAEMQQCGVALKAAWGESLNMNTMIAGKAAQTIFGKDLAEKIDAMGLGRDPQFVMAMHKIGSRSLEELGIDAKGASTKTPSDLDGEIKALMGHPAYFDRKHVEHKQTVAKVTALMERRHPANAA